MRDTIPDSYGVRDTLDSQSNAAVSSIPQNAQERRRLPLLVRLAG